MKPESFISHLLVWLLLAGASASSRADVLDNWTTNQIATNSFGFHHLVYGNGIYVALGEAGDSGGFYTSPDGLNWKLQYSEPNSWGNTLTFSSGHFASVAPYRSGFNAADVSADGTNWITSIFVEVDYQFTPSAIAYGNGLYVVVGSTNNGASIMTSPDGTTWTHQQAGASPGGLLTGVAYGNSRFIAIGNNDGNVYISGPRSAGTSWTKFTILGGSSISYANGLFFVPLNNRTNLLSTDGTSWMAAPTGLTNQLGAVSYSHGIYLAQCRITANGSYLATSADGTNWFQYSKLLPNVCAIYDTGDYDVAVATDGTRLITGSSVFLGFYFNSFVYASDPFVSIRRTNGVPMSLAISGLVGRNYQIQSTTNLASSGTWQTNTTLQLTNTPIIWTDSTATNSARFYRGVLLP